MDSTRNEILSFHEFMLNTRPWCLGVHDYCPLVITCMSMVIIVSLFAIVLICVRNRHLLVCQDDKIQVQEMAQQQTSVVSSQLNTLPGDSLSYQAAIQSSHIPQVFPRKSAIRISPPTYEESQTKFEVRQVTSSSDNNAFLVDDDVQSAQINNNYFTHQKSFRNASFMSTDSFVFTSKPRFQRQAHLATRAKCFLQPSLQSFEIPPSYDDVINSSVKRMNNANYDILSEELLSSSSSSSLSNRGAIISEFECIV